MHKPNACILLIDEDLHKNYIARVGEQLITTHAYGLISLSPSFNIVP